MAAPCSARKRGLLHHLPRAVRLTARGAIGLFALAADIHGGLVFAAIVAGLVLAVAHRGIGAKITAVGVVPADGLAHGRSMGAAFRLIGILLVGAVQAFAHFRTDIGAQKRAQRGHGQVALAFAELCPGHGAADAAQDGAAGLLGAVIVGTSGQHSGDDENTGGLGDEAGHGCHAFPEFERCHADTELGLFLGRPAR